MQSAEGGGGNNVSAGLLGNLGIITGPIMLSSDLDEHIS